MKAILGIMGAPTADLQFLTGPPHFNCPYWFNGGLLVGRRRVFLMLDRQLRQLAPRSLLWLEGGSAATYTDEFLMNLCIGLLRNTVDMPTSFNMPIF